MLATSQAPHVQVPALVAVELQDSLRVAVHDLKRLESLLSHASNQLLQRFGDADHSLGQAPAGTQQHWADARSALQAAVTELQFQDMASQLIAHTTQMLQACAFRLAAQTGGGGEGEVAGDAAARVVPRCSRPPNPVTQSEMNAGSIELF